MDDPLPQMNAHVRRFAAKHQLRLRTAEDGEVRILLGPRKTENHASYAYPSRKVWKVYFTAPSPERVVRDVRSLALRCTPLDGEGYFEVKESDLLKACALNRWIKPRLTHAGVERDRQAAMRAALVASLGED